MPLPPPDRVLRRVVAELATASNEDIEAVLDELDPRQRETVRGLLEDLVGASSKDARAATGEDAGAVARRIGLSSWLVPRVCGEGTGPTGVSFAVHSPAGAQPEFVMTPTAAAALRSAVLEAEQSDRAVARAASILWWRRLRRGVPAIASS